MSSPSSSSSSTKADNSFGAADIDGKTLTQSFQNNCNIGAHADYIVKPIDPDFPAPISTSLPELSCSVCYRECHTRDSCPYFKDIPRGADFDRAKFIAYCFFGHPKFDTDEWVCPCEYCPSKYFPSKSASLRPKKCKICGAKEEHTTDECTVDNHYSYRFRTHFSLYEPCTVDNHYSNRLGTHYSLYEPGRGKLTQTPEESFKARRENSLEVEEYLIAECENNSIPMPNPTSLPELSCSVCYSICHARDSCPYFKDLPKGANFDRAKFTAHCFYGDPYFDTDKWVCGDKYCSSQSAKLRPKKCKYCGVEEEHTSKECTVDNHYTARLKNPRIDLHQPSRAKLTRTAEEYYKYKAERAKSFKTKEYLRAESSDNSIPMFI